MFFNFPQFWFSSSKILKLSLKSLTSLKFKISLIICLSKKNIRFNITLFDYVWNVFTYSFMIPINIYFTTIVITLIHQKSLEKKQANLLKINNPEAIASLEHIDYAIFDKTGTLTQKKLSLDSLFFDNKNFLIQHDLLPKIKNEFDIKIKKNQLFYSIDNDNLFDHINLHDSPIFQKFPNDKIPSSRIKLTKNKSNPTEVHFTSKEILRKERSSPFELLKNDSIEIDFDNISQQEYPDLKNFENLSDFKKLISAKNLKLLEMLKCLSLTHSGGLMKSTTRGIGEETKKAELYHYEDELLINFCADNGVTFDSCNFDHKFDVDSSSIFYILKDDISGKILRLNVLAINEFSYTRKRFSIVFEDLERRDHFLYCKGKSDVMKEKLNLTSKSRAIYDKIIQKYSEKGLRIVVFAKRRLDKGEANTYFFKFNDLKQSVISKKKELENLAIEMECDLTLIAIIGFKETLRPDAEKTISLFKQLNTKIWILTGDSFTNAFNTALACQLFNHSQAVNCIHFKITDPENLRFFLRDTLAEIKQNVLELYRRDREDDGNEEVLNSVELKRFILL